MDESVALIPLISRWVHMLSAVIAVGGSITLAMVTLPALQTAGEAERASLRDAVMKRWKRLFHPLILLFLVTGFYNYIAVTSGLHEGQSLYHALFGVKFLLALVVFGLAIVATSTMAWSERLRQGKGLWAALVLTSVAVVLIAGYMRLMPVVAPE